MATSLTNRSCSSIWCLFSSLRWFVPSWTFSLFACVQNSLPNHLFQSRRRLKQVPLLFVHSHDQSISATVRTLNACSASKPARPTFFFPLSINLTNSSAARIPTCILATAWLQYNLDQSRNCSYYPSSSTNENLISYRTTTSSPRARKKKIVFWKVTCFYFGSFYLLDRPSAVSSITFASFYPSISLTGYIPTFALYINLHQVCCQNLIIYNMWAEIFRRAVDENGTPSIHDPWPAKDVSYRVA